MHIILKKIAYLNLTSGGAIRKKQDEDLNIATSNPEVFEAMNKKRLECSLAMHNNK